MYQQVNHLETLQYCRDPPSLPDRPGVTPLAIVMRDDEASQWPLCDFDHHYIRIGGAHDDHPFEFHIHACAHGIIFRHASRNRSEACNATLDTDPFSHASNAFTPSFCRPASNSHTHAARYLTISVSFIAWIPAGELSARQKKKHTPTYNRIRIISARTGKFSVRMGLWWPSAHLNIEVATCFFFLGQPSYDYIVETRVIRWLASHTCKVLSRFNYNCVTISRDFRSSNTQNTNLRFFECPRICSK